MIYDIVFTLACIGLLTTMVIAALWVIKRLFHWHKANWVKGKYVGFIFLVAIVLTFVAPATQTKAQRAEQARQDHADTVSESRGKAASESRHADSESRAKAKSNSESRMKVQKKLAASKKESERKASSESKKKASAKAVSISKAKKASESKAKVTKASKKAKAKRNPKKASKSNSIASYLKKYKYVSLEKLTENPYKYDAGLIKTTGNVVLIQRNHDDSNMYYVVIAPKDSYSSSGYSDGHGSVTEIDVDTMKEHSIHEGDKITVYGSVMEDTVKLNGKILKTDIIVDRVSK